MSEANDMGDTNEANGANEAKDMSDTNDMKQATPQASGARGHREAGHPRTILFVCHGNICRSPLAEGVLNHLAKQAGIERELRAASAGVIGMHSGERPDSRMSAVARQKGIALTSRGRQFERDDFDDYDLIVTMDRSNYASVFALAATPQERDRVIMFRAAFEAAGREGTAGRDGTATGRDGAAGRGGEAAQDGAALRYGGDFDDENNIDVPDPYYGGRQGFENVYNIVLRGCQNIVERYRAGTLFA